MRAGQTGRAFSSTSLCAVRNVVRAGDVVDADRAAISGLVKTIAAEQPWLSCRLIDVPADAGMIPALLEELAGDRADGEVALRADGRFVPRLEQAAIAESTGAIPFKTDGRYVINGADGIGKEIERYLIARHNAKVLLLNVEPAAIAGKVTEFESANGALDGVIHICAAHRERALLDETADGLAAELAGDIDGCRQLAEIARSRPGCLFIAFTSATAFFGGATAGAIASGAASVTAIVEGLRASSTASCFTFAWSAWSHQAEGAGDSVQLARATGFHLVSLKQGLVAFLAGLRMGPGSYLVGLDGQHPRVRSKVSNASVALTQPVVCFTSPSLVDAAAFASYRGSRSLRRDEPRAIPATAGIGSCASCAARACGRQSPSTSSTTTCCITCSRMMSAATTATRWRSSARSKTRSWSRSAPAAKRSSRASAPKPARARSTRSRLATRHSVMRRHWSKSLGCRTLST